MCRKSYMTYICIILILIHYKLLFLKNQHLTTLNFSSGYQIASLYQFGLHYFSMKFGLTPFCKAEDSLDVCLKEIITDTSYLWKSYSIKWILYLVCLSLSHVINTPALPDTLNDHSRAWFQQYQQFCWPWNGIKLSNWYCYF